MLPVGFEATISADKRPQTYTLDRAATGISKFKRYKKLKNVTETVFFFFFFFFFSFLIGWQLSIWICSKPFFSFLYNCQLLCFWQLAVSTVVEVFPQPFFRILLIISGKFSARWIHHNPLVAALRS
jgi:hypothetical protein